MAELTADQILDAELKREAFLKSGYGIRPDDTVKVIEAFASDKWETDKKRPGIFNRHSLFGDVDKNERMAQIWRMQALELFRSIYKPITQNSAQDLVNSNELVSAFIGFSSRARDGKERQYLSKTISEVITSKTDDSKKKGFGRIIPFRGR